MLPKLFATWLVVLVVLPFTAPFSTCDLASVFGGPHGKRTPVARRPSVTSATDAAVPTAHRAPARGRVRVLPLRREPLALATTSSALAAVMSSESGRGGAPPMVRAPILRV
ncbi:MAG TPA: hypothetical protein VFK70_04600 [Vicinamibacteria bacterium]|nr:hypothetical protein [Vicinamibacteria bacterium]